jgi:hypothetical protein
MKTFPFLTIGLFLCAALVAGITGCKYDVAEPLYDTPVAQGTESPTITRIDPADSARPGVNTITIYGTNFSGAIDTTTVHGANVDTTILYSGIYFSGPSTTALAEVMELSSTSIKVRRPNLATDSCTVKVVPSKALVAAKFGPYKIAEVIRKYGSFLDNVGLSVVAVDNSENLYVVYTDSRNIYKVTPDGVKMTLGVATRAPTDARIGPGGNLYLTGNNRAIDVVDVQAGTVTRWLQLPSGRVVKFGDFDAQGYFYTAGTRSQLVIVAPNLSVIQTGLYAADDVLGIRVYDGYVYLAVQAASGTTPSLAIWKHSLDSVAINGHLGPAQLVLNLDGTQFASRTIKAFAVSASGTIYIGTDSPDPLLIADPATSQMDYFYKGIVPAYCKHLCWGKGNYLYIISGNTSPAQEWTVYRINMGATGAPFYGG